jgi:hypothetical protein
LQGADSAVVSHVSSNWFANLNANRSTMIGYRQIEICLNNDLTPAQRKILKQLLKDELEKRQTEDGEADGY